jgi:hypothetical protein
MPPRWNWASQVHSVRPDSAISPRRGCGWRALASAVMRAQGSRLALVE